MNRWLLLSALVGAILILPGSLVLLEVASDGSVFGFGIIPLLPGLIGSMAIGNNAHAFSAWVAIILSFVLWTSIVFGILQIVKRRRLKNART